MHVEPARTAIDEALARSQQHRGQLLHEAEVRKIAAELIEAMKRGALDANDLRAIADCLETACRKGTRLVAV